MAERMASLSVDSKDSIELPVHAASVGPDVIDVSGLTSQGYFTYDPGFVSTASCNSNITYIDGDEGILLHCGYPIEQLAERSDFLELCYLLLNGELPAAAEKDDFVETIKRHGKVDEQLLNFYGGFRRDAHPMAIMCGVVGSAVGLLPQLPGHRGRIRSAGYGASPYRENAYPGGDEL